MKTSRFLLLAVFTVVMLPLRAAAQDPALVRQAAADAAAGVTRFKCHLAQDVTTRFVTREARLLAIVDAGDGAHELSLEPWTGGPAQMRWSDGRRTLTWRPGVQISWTDGPSQRTCGRGGHRH